MSQPLSSSFKQNPVTEANLTVSKALSMLPISRNKDLPPPVPAQLPTQLLNPPPAISTASIVNQLLYKGGGILRRRGNPHTHTHTSERVDGDFGVGGKRSSFGAFPRMGDFSLPHTTTSERVDFFYPEGGNLHPCTVDIRLQAH